MRRRHFLATLAACALPWRRLHAATPGPRIRPFALSRVRLRSGPMLDAAEVNRRFVLGQDVDRLLHNFRRHRGPSVERSAARRLGGPGQRAARPLRRVTTSLHAP